MESLSAIRSPRIRHAHGSTNTVGCGTGHLAAATPTWKQSSATEHSMVARDDGTVNTDSGVNSEWS